MGLVTSWEFGCMGPSSKILITWNDKLFEWMMPCKFFCTCNFSNMIRKTKPLLSLTSFLVGGTVAWESTHTSPVTNPWIIQIGRLFISCHGWQACNYLITLLLSLSLSLSLSLTHTHTHTNAYTYTPTNMTYLRPCICIQAYKNLIPDICILFKGHFLTGLFLYF